MSKAIVNIVYTPQTDAPHKVYENEKGEIWRSGKYDFNKINIGMGWYSIRKPKPIDGIWVVEPFCILERDYDKIFLKGFRNIYTWAVKAFDPGLQQKIVEMNHPTYHHFSELGELEKHWVKWSDKEDEIIFVANNKSSQHHSELYSLRLQLADMFDKKSKFKVSWYGQIPIKRPYYRGTVDNKRDVVAKAKFSVCTENSYDPIYTHGYFTEKLPDVWMAGTVPLYMGCYNVDDFDFPEHSYIDLRKYVKKSGKKFKVDEKTLIDRIENFSEERYNNWLDDVREVLKPEKLKKLSSYDLAYEKIIEKCHANLNK